MNIRNRIPDIKDLQTHMLQDFLQIVIDANYTDESWKEKLAKSVEKGVKGKYKSNYAGASAKIRRVKSLSEYNVTDMDITFILTVLKYESSVINTNKKINGALLDALNRLKDDRNFDSHLTGNESLTELYHWVIVTINDIRHFIEIFDDQNEYDNEIRINFLRKYTEKINTISELVEKDRVESFREMEFLHNIELIRNHKDPDYMWRVIYGMYEAQMRKERNAEILTDFILKAAESGISQAYSMAADCYYDPLYKRVDLYKVAELYSKCDKLLPYERVRLASLYINGYDANHSKEEGEIILDEVRTKLNKSHIEECDRDGQIFYEIRR